MTSVTNRDNQVKGQNAPTYPGRRPIQVGLDMNPTDSAGTGRRARRPQIS